MHEAGHAVIARALGVAVPTVTVRSAAPVAETTSAAYLADDLGVAARIAAL